MRADKNTKSGIDRMASTLSGGMVLWMVLLCCSGCGISWAPREVARPGAKSAATSAVAAEEKGRSYDLYEEGRYAEAAREAEKEASREEAKYGLNHAVTVRALNHLATIYRAEGRYQEALILYQKIRKNVDSRNPEMVATFLGLGLLFEQMDQYTEAEQSYIASNALARELYGDGHPEQIPALHRIGTLNFKQGEYLKAQMFLGMSIVIWFKNRGVEGNEEIFRYPVADIDEPLVASGMNSLGWILHEQGNYQAAEPYYKKALEIHTNLLGADHPTVGIDLNNLANLYRDEGAYGDAEPLLERALTIFEKAQEENHPQLAHILGNLAILYDQQGRYAESESYYKRALAILEQKYGPEHVEVASILSSMGDSYRIQGQYEKADSLLERALRIYEKEEGREQRDVVYPLNNLALSYYHQGRLEEAASLLERSLEIAEKTLGTDHLQVAQGLSNLANVYMLQARYDEAGPLLERAFSITEKSTGIDNHFGGIIVNNLALLYHYQGRYEEASRFYNRALIILSKSLGERHPQLADILINRLALEVKLGGDLRRVMMGMQIALDIDENTIHTIFSAASEREKLDFLQTLSSRTDLMYSLAVREMKSSPDAVRMALEVALNRKGIVLDALAHERLALIESGDAQTAAMARKHQEISSQLASLALSGPGAMSPDSYRSRLQGLEAEKERLEEELSRLSPVYEERQQRRKISAGQVVERLGAGSALIEYISYLRWDFEAFEWQEPRYLAFVLSADRAGEPVLIDLGKAETIERAVRDFRREVAGSLNAFPGSEIGAEQRLAEKGRRIYELVFAPLEEAIGGKRTLYLAPDGDLNLIPFGVLPDATGKYLVENYQLDYLSSGRDLLRPEKTGKANRRALIVADPDYDLRGSRTPVAPGRDLSLRSGAGRLMDLQGVHWDRLPATRREAETIASKLPDLQVTMHMGEDAVEEAVEKAESPRLIHLATHGFFLEERAEAVGAETARGLLKKNGSIMTGPLQDRAPSGLENPLLRSGLVLAGANHLGESASTPAGGDGVLTALEISGIPLWDTDLVVLSACETGLGETRRGEGVFGLRRAFQLAGARTVVMSLWSVPDEETMLLMSDFYDRLERGVPKARALQEATLALMRQRRDRNGAAHPFYWGAFVCVGDPGLNAVTK